MGYHNSTIHCSIASQEGRAPATSVATVADAVPTKEAIIGVHVIKCQISHIFGPSGDEVVQVYHVPPTGLKVDHPLPFKRLIAFDRIHLPASATGVTVAFNITTEDLRLTDKAGGQSLYSGNHGLSIWMGHGEPQNLTIVVPPFVHEVAATNATVADHTKER
jgi:hypothetical protein